MTIKERSHERTAIQRIHLHPASLRKLLVFKWTSKSMPMLGFHRPWYPLESRSTVCLLAVQCCPFGCCTGITGFASRLPLPLPLSRSPPDHHSLQDKSWCNDMIHTPNHASNQKQKFQKQKVSHPSSLLST